ncbi:hypothetical protein, partial [Polaribacter sp.]|uniref:hypothetical protein n=1 Tax=Polaribacter sp. TaxID=1920175 RepID=UPI003F6CA89F
MKLKTNYKFFASFLILSIFFATPVNAQFWKKLKKKAQEKISKAEDKLLDKFDKKTDKVIDSTLNGKKKNKKIKESAKENKKIETGKRSKSYGSSSIMHSILYGAININDLSKTKVEKTGKKVSIIGYWGTFGVDVHDGYIINLKNVDNIDNLQNKTFKIPEEASLQLDYDALVKGQYNFDQKVRAPQQGVKFSSGTVTITFNKEQNISINFSGKAKLKNHKNDNKDLAFGEGDTPATISGMINTTEPKYTITRERKEKQKNTIDNLSEEEKMEMFKKAIPTVNIPSTFSFNKVIKVKMTDERGDSQTVDFLTGSYPDIYGMSVTGEQMGGQEMLIVNTPKASTMFMNMAGMKIKKST